MGKGMMNDITFDDVWNRIVEHAGEGFSTITGCEFVYTINGDVFRTNRTDYNIPKNDFLKAFNVWPVNGPGEINQLVRGPAYIWGVLNDERIIPKGAKNMAIQHSETQYGKAAVKAVTICKTDRIPSVPKAWIDAICEFTDATSSQRKPCPMETFIGLCLAGLVKDVEKGVTRFCKNKDYGIQAVKVLKNNPDLAKSTTALWNAIDNNGENHNSQMDVVIALWNAGLINQD
jgi:hypothetical protein